jgi:hypothetical protein
MTGMLQYVLSNSEADKKAVMQEAEDFGRREGNGVAARAAFYANLTEWAQEKRIEVTDADEMWLKYAQGASAGASIIGGTRLTDENADVLKVRVSECRQFIKLGWLMHTHRHTNGVEVLDRAMVIIKQAKLDNTLKMKPTDAMIAVAREQNKDGANPLDDDTIERKIHPSQDNEKKEEDRLESVRIELERIEKKFGRSNDVAAAQACVAARIKALGGTSSAKRAAKALAKKQAKGQV